MALTQDLERSSASVLKSASTARAKIEAADENVAEVENALETASNSRLEAEGRLKEAQAQLARAKAKASKRS